MSKKGKFITLEGGEGAGKSTQVQSLVASLERCGHRAIATREVGGTPEAEEIRKLWLGKHENFWDSLTEVLLIMAARREHLTRVIWPALADGVWVVSDRYLDSTRAYQGICMNLGISKIDTLYQEIAGDFQPDLTLLLDLPVAVGRARVASRRGPDDRYEQKPDSFHEKLRQAYLTIASEDAQRCKIIDAAHDAEAVSKKIADVTAQHFDLTFMA